MGLALGCAGTLPKEGRHRGWAGSALPASSTGWTSTALPGSCGLFPQWCPWITSWHWEWCWEWPGSPGSQLWLRSWKLSPLLACCLSNALGSPAGTRNGVGNGQALSGLSRTWLGSWRLLLVSRTCLNKLLFSLFSSSCPRSCSHPCSRYSGPSCNPSCAALTSVCRSGGCSSINLNNFQGSWGALGGLAPPPPCHCALRAPAHVTHGWREGFPGHSRSNSTGLYLPVGYI